MNKKNMLIVMFTIIGALVVSAFSWAAITRFNDSQDLLTVDLTSLNADEVTAYRWDAMAKFYAGQASATANLSWPSRPDFSHLNLQAQIPVTGRDLTTLSADNILTYRWQAMADFYTGQTPTTVQYGPPGR